MFAEFRWCCLRGSNASTTICSVPLISALQNGHPCKCRKNEIELLDWNLVILKLDCRLLPVLRSLLAMQLDMACTVNDHTVRFECPYHFPHKFCTIETYSLKRNRHTIILHIGVHVSAPFPTLTHFAIKLVLLLSDGNMIFHWTLHGKR